MSASHFDQPRLDALSRNLCFKLDDVFLELGVSLERQGRRYIGCCPVHGGDRVDACNLYWGGEWPGKWKCHTRGCQEVFRKTAIGFVRGVLSHRKYSWGGKGDRTISFNQAVDWCCSFLGTKWNQIEVDENAIAQQKFAQMAGILGRLEAEKNTGIDRRYVRSHLQLSPAYLLDRGFSPELLDRYDIGLCDNPRKPFFGRVVIPVYDESRSYVAGCLGRSIYDQCDKCALWHQPGPCPRNLALAAKWRNSNFPAERHLFNWWFAKQHIKKEGVCCLCEGPLDVLALEQAGIHTGVAMFGTSLSDSQQILLETSGVRKLILLQDNDSAGLESVNAVKASLGRYYYCVRPEFPGKDVGGLTPTQVQESVWRSL